MMKAITFKNYGDPTVLEMSEIPIPTVGPEQLLVQVKATALNRADLLQRRGQYTPPPGESDILGLEIAGDVIAIGPSVTQHKIGDRVFGLVGSGGYAEFCLIDQYIAMPMPRDFSYEEAAAVPEAFLTANEALFTLGQLKSEETVLIHAGASGVGSASIQLAKAIDARVFTTVRSSKKIAQVNQLNPDLTIDTSSQNFSSEVEKHFNADVIIDFVGASYFSQNILSLKPGGRLISIGLLGGTKVEINLADLIHRRLQIKGLIMRSRSLADKRAITERFYQQWYLHLAEHKIHSIIDSVYSWTEVQKAHQYMENNKNVGKIILDLSRDS